MSKSSKSPGEMRAVFENARALVDGTWKPETREQAEEFLALVDQFQQEADLAVWKDQRDRDAEHSGETQARRHKAKAAELNSIRRKLSNSAEGHAAGAAAKVAGRETDKLDAEQYREFTNKVNAATSLLDADEKLAKVQHRHEAAARVVAEPGPYGAGSPHSWIADRIASVEPGAMGLFASRSGASDLSASAVEARLTRHGEDVTRALRTRATNRYGKAIRRMLHEGHRCEDEEQHRRLTRDELRVFTTGGGATASASGGGGAAFVPPAILLDRWVAYRSPFRSYASQCTPETLPEYGMEVYVAQVTTGASVGTVTEGSPVSEGTPVTNLINAPVVLKSGEILVSQPFLDRAGPGVAGDLVMFDQIHNQLDAQIDEYAIKQTISAGAVQAVTNNGTFSLTAAVGSLPGVGGLLGDLKHGKSKLADTAGVRLRGTHMFASSDICDYIAAWADAQGRPVFSPDFTANRLPIRSDGDSLAEGFTGYVLVGLALFAEDQIPNSGTTSNQQILVSRPETVLHMEGAVIPFVYPPTVAGSLEAVLGVRQYVATIPRYPSGTAIVGGSAYASSTFA